MTKVLFVCLGNICRSPMAEFVFKQELADRNLSDDYHVESRATSSWEHGNPIYGGTQDIFKKHGIAYDSSKSSQQISADDFKNYDVIYAMDDNNLADLKEMAPAGYEDKVELFLGNKNVPDPYYTRNFDETYELVSQGCKEILDKKQEKTFIC